MRDYKERADKILERRNAALAKRHRRKKALYRYSVPAAALCVAVTVCFGALLWSGNDITTVPSDISSFVQSSRSADSEAVTREVTTDAPKISETASVTSVSKEENKETQPQETTVYEYEEYEYEQIPEQTQAETLPAETTVTEPPAEQLAETVTESVQEPDDTLDPYNDPDYQIETGTFRLTETDDPIWVFSHIYYEGVRYGGNRYMTETDADKFYIAWSDETEITTYDTHMCRDVTEPVTIMGLSSKDSEPSFIIIRFKNYNIYSLYMAEEERDYSDYSWLLDDE